MSKPYIPSDRRNPKFMLHGAWMDSSHSTPHRSHPWRGAPPFWPFKLSHRVCLQANNSINYFYRREALRGLPAALLDEGKAVQVVPSGYRVGAACRLLCYHKPAAFILRPQGLYSPCTASTHSGTLYVDALRQIVLHPADLFVKLPLPSCLCPWRCSFAGAK